MVFELVYWNEEGNRVCVVEGHCSHPHLDTVTICCRCSMSKIEVDRVVVTGGVSGG